MGFWKYWKLQFKDLKEMRGFAKFVTLLMMLNPSVVHTMWLYDTGRITPDERFMEE